MRGITTGTDLAIDVSVLNCLRTMLTVLRLTRRTTYPVAGELVAEPSPHQNHAGDRTFTSLGVTGVAGHPGASAGTRVPALPPRRLVP